MSHVGTLNQELLPGLHLGAGAQAHPSEAFADSFLGGWTAAFTGP